MAPVLDKGLTGQETYQALLRLYTIALQQAVDMQEGNFSWVSLHTNKVSLCIERFKWQYLTEADLKLFNSGKRLLVSSTLLNLTS